jgi:hypothetical protein
MLNFHLSEPQIIHKASKEDLTFIVIMCIESTAEFPTCGHSMAPLTWRCPSPDSNIRITYRVEWTCEKPFCPLFCAECLLLPDPRTSAEYQRISKDWPVNENRAIFEGAHLEAQEILKRAEKLGTNEFSDPFEFVKLSLLAMEENHSSDDELDDGDPIPVDVEMVDDYLDDLEYLDNKSIDGNSADDGSADDGSNDDELFDPEFIDNDPDGDESDDDELVPGLSLRRPVIHDGRLTDIPWLGADIRRSLHDTYTVLHVSFWFCLEAKNMQVPSLAHRILLIQLQFYLTIAGLLNA